MSAILEATFARAHSFVADLDGWRRYGFACGCGVVTAFAQAPYYLLPCLIIGFSGLVWLMDQAVEHAHRNKVSFFTGWWFAFGYLYVSIYWLAFSFFHNADSTWDLVMLAGLGFVGVAGAAAFIALFYGAATLCAGQLWKADWTRILVLGIGWSIAEYGRGHVLTGFPWNLTGQSFAGTPVLAQAAAIIGPYGLSLVVIVLAAIPALSVSQQGQDRKFSVLPAALVAVSMVLIVAYGVGRLAVNPVRYKENIRLQIVQPNVAQRDKLNPAKFPDNFMASYELSGGEVVDTLDPDEQLYIIWPENASYDYFQRDAVALELLQEALPLNAILISGAIRIDRSDPEAEKYYNSLHVIADLPVQDNNERRLLEELMEDSRKRMIVGSYDKHHLAPFGEYVPLVGLFKAMGIDKLVPLNDSLSRGAGPSVLDLGRTIVAPIICYETIFPGRLYPNDQRPEWMVTVTNDAWFGDSVGPSQHLAQARLRSIENGLAMVRSANTGISAVIDPYGRLLHSLPLSERGAIVSGLPAPATTTIYARLGDFPYFCLMVMMAGMLVVWRHRRSG